MKEYRQIPAAVELVVDGKARVITSWLLPSSDTGLSDPSQDAEEVLIGFLKITQRAMVKRRSWVNRTVGPCLHPSLTHHRSINPFENKV